MLSEKSPSKSDVLAPLTLDREQAEAVQLILSAPIGVITGGAGTGKTSVLKLALDELDKRGLSYALCAPTGKAARRMTEATGRPALTIHRLLEWKLGAFQRTEDYPIGVRAVLVDESSMIDILLAAHLLRAINFNQTRIIFIGDANQLPPVGPGAFFRDLIASTTVPVVRLLTLHRSALASWIYRNAPKVLTGDPVELDDLDDFQWYQLPTDSAGYVARTVVELAQKLTSEGVARDDLQVLVPMKDKVGGVHELNRELQRAFNPLGKHPRLHVFDSDFHRDDTVIHTRNNYELGISNGEIGRIHGDVSEAGLTLQLPDGTFIRYSRRDANQLQLAYALTIHKFQGSQVKNVVVVCHSEHSSMLTRQLFYTAITRARERVFVVGDVAGMKRALSTFHDTQRRTLLQQRLRGEL